jgi:MarR family transcriptional regulator, organic hydroperoxide resistance regulator
MSDQEDLSSKLIYAARLCRSLRARLLREHGLFAGQDALLKSLARTDGQTMGSLAANLGVRPPTVTKMVTRMESQGLVRRETSGFDSRLAIVHLLEAGSSLVAKIDEAWHLADAQAFGRMKEKDAKRLHKILDKIVEGADAIADDET